MSLKFQKKKTKSLKINKFHTLVAVNNFQLFKQRPETPLPLSLSLLSVRENWNAHTKLFKYAKLWSYHDGTSDFEANSPWQWVFLAVSQRLSSCRGSQAVGETGVSQLLGVGVIAGSLGLGACIHFQKTFVFVRYSFVERVLNIYLWGIRQPVARPREPF